MLKDDAAIGTRRAHWSALDENLAGFGGEEAANEIQQRRLAAAGRSQQRDELADAHIERDVLECEHRPPTGRSIEVAHACNDDLCLRHGPLPLPARRLRRRKLAKSPDAAKPRRALTSLRSAPSSAPYGRALHRAVNGREPTAHPRLREGDARPGRHPRGVRRSSVMCSGRPRRDRHESVSPADR